MSHPSTERLHALDAVRGFALLLGVALHATLSYLPGAKAFWIVADDSSLALAGLFYWIHLFRMTLFFLIAGFFGRLLLERLGLRAFVRDRMRRIVAVLACAWPLVFPAIVLVLVGATAVQHGGTLPPTPPPPPMSASNFPLTHLWFLYVLAMFYGAALALRGMAGLLDRRARAMACVDAIARKLSGPAAAFVLAMPAALALAMTAKWPMWFGVPTPDTGLVPNTAALVSYGVAFACGWLLQRQPPLLARITSTRWHNLLVALAGTAGCLAIVGLKPVLAPAAGDATTWIYAGLYAAAGWAWALALLGLALRYCAGYSATRRYLSDASYWIYLVHLPLVMALQVWTSRLALPWWFEFPLLLAVGTALMLGSYEWFVRHGRIGAWLNGKRVPRAPARKLQATHVAG
jgi:peptidoglycan/LPS O-acetylase OafA/YrhL